jgi:magnesium transporter
MLMKRLTILTIIFMPLNVIASLFGMSEYTEFIKGFLGMDGFNPLLQLGAYSLFGVVLGGIGYLTYKLLRFFKLD